MERSRWPRGSNNLAYARASHPDLRGPAQNRPFSFILSRVGNWGQKLTRRAGEVGKDEHSCLHTGQDVATYGSDR